MQQPEQPAASMDILLAEDNAVNQRLTESIMDKLGHRLDVLQKPVRTAALATMVRRALDAAATWRGQQRSRSH